MSAPSSPVPPGPAVSGAHPLLWARMPAEQPAPPTPRTPEEALAMMERGHATTMALLPEDDGDPEETTPLTRAWFDAVREACARTGPVPGVDRMLFEWWIDHPPIEGLAQLPWLFGVWQGHWICWAGTTPWAAADLAATSTYDAARVAEGVQFGADPSSPPANPWPPFGTSALAVPTIILLALSGKPAPKDRVIPVTPLPIPTTVIEESAAPDIAPMAPIEPPPAPAQPQDLPPAAWYPDPSGRHALRYWDGAQWTAHAADPGTDAIHDPI